MAQQRGKNMITLGQKAKDKITGFEGILIAHVRYLTGCDQYALVPPAENGEVKSAQYFDEGRIEITGPGVSAVSVVSARNGGPNRDSPRGL
jgi:hypothetical protein